jgi:hypothetical protein
MDPASCKIMRAKLPPAGTMMLSGAANGHAASTAEMSL